MLKRHLLKNIFINKFSLLGKQFPRLLCCPDFTHYDPHHIDGCVPDYAPVPLPPPIYGSPDPFIHHLGAPLELGAPVIKRETDMMPGASRRSIVFEK